MGRLRISGPCAMARKAGLCSYFPYSGTPGKDVPVTVVKDLFSLQQLDLAIDRRMKRLAQIKAALKEDAVLAGARKDQAASQAASKDLQSKQKTLELDLATAKSRYATVEMRMMSNEGVTARELPAMERELAHVKQQQKSLEEQGVVLLETLQKTHAQAQAHAAKVQELEQAWRESQRDLLAEQAALQAELTPSRAEREGQAAGVQAVTMQAYERLRIKKAGVAVARVEKGICTGCRISLPTMLIQQARAGKVLATCPTCGRIMFAE